MTVAPHGIDHLTPLQKRELLARLAAQRQAEPRHVPLSFAQERLWFLDQLAPGSAFYNQNLAMRADRALDDQLLARALDEVVARHASLRTTFEAVDGRPVQIVHAALTIPVRVVDLTSLPEAEREEQVGVLAVEEGIEPFDLATGPLLRATLVQVAADESVLLLTLHHIVSDGWSVAVLLNELQVAYEAFAAGRPLPLAPLKLQYTDYAVWQRSWLKGEVLDRQRAWWRERLQDLPRLELPLDRPRPEVASYRGAYHAVEVPESVVARLRALATHEGATPFIVLLAAFQALLARYSGQDDVVVGVPVANRGRAELEPLIGFFVNTLVMRVDLSGDPSFRDALRRVKEVALGAQANQDVPFEQLVHELQPERDTSRNPLFQVSFQLFNAPAATDAQPVAGFALQPMAVERGTSNLDMAFDLYEGEGGLSGTIEYSTDVFEAPTIARMAAHFVALLDAVAERPDLPLSSASLLAPGDRQLVLEEWNATAVDYPRQARIEELVLDAARRTPDAPALIFEDQTIAYEALAAGVRRLAERLVAAGAAEHQVVAVCLERSPDLVVALLAVLAAGAGFLALDPALPRERLQLLLDDAGASLLVTHSALAGRLPAAPSCLFVDRDEAGGLPTVGRTGDAEDLACLIYTSGSTGVPKGVAIPHRALVNQVCWMRSQFPLAPADRTLFKYSISFDAALVEMLYPLVSGACLVIARDGGQLDAGYLTGLIDAHGITLLDLTPSLLAALLDDQRFVRCRSLRWVLCGGEQLPADLAARCRRLLPASSLHNVYGPAEATVTSASFDCATELDQLSTVPIGRPIANMRAYVLDASLEPLPPGVRGDLHLAGDGLSLGYWRRDDLTAERFVPDPFRGAGNKMYRTGDVARWRADGNLEFLGRADAQIKLRGFRIEPAEIEACFRRHPAVRDAVVTLEAGPAARAPHAAEALAQALASLPPAAVEGLLAEAETLADEEATFLSQPGPPMIRKHRAFDLMLRLREKDFLRHPGDAQRNWILNRALDECGDDLEHLDEVSRRFVAGSERPPIDGDLAGSAALYDAERLVINGQQVMDAWERPLMAALADAATATHGDVLEVGFGMGISATDIQERGVRSHTIIECNDDVIRTFERWRSRYPGRDIRLVKGVWQEVAAGCGPFDAILFDTYPLNEDEFNEAVVESVTFAAAFVPVAASLLRDGGVFTYYTNEIDTFSRRHQRLLLSHFRSLTLSVVRGLQPPDDCHYWWADSMVVVSAKK